MSKYFLLYTGSVILLLWAPFVVLVNGEEDDDGRLDITQRQIHKLDQFKKQVSHQLTHDYMKTDTYLVRWLRVNNFDVTHAEDALMENLKWRKEFKMDNIQQEEFSDIKDMCPFYADTIAKTGQPVFTLASGQCNLRQLFETGKGKRFLRYIFQQLDKATMMVMEAAQAGKNVTRFMILGNVGGFNILQLRCPQCITEISDFGQQFEKFYPEIIDKVVIINTPSYIRTAVSPLIPIVFSRCSSLDRIKVKLLGTDRREWRPYLLELIEEKQLHKDFGGSRTEHS